MPVVPLSFVLTSFLMVLTPGPSSAMMIDQSLHHGRGAGMAAVIGNITGSVMWMTASVLGLTALIRTSETAFLVLKIAGAVYLCWMGVRALIKSRSLRTEQVATPEIQNGPANGVLAAAYRGGLLANVTNPKVGMVYLVLFPQFMPVGGNDLLNAVVLAVVQLMITVGWYSTVVFAVDLIRRGLSKPVVKMRIAQVSGLVFVALGVKMITMSSASLV